MLNDVLDFNYYFKDLTRHFKNFFLLQLSCLLQIFSIKNFHHIHHQFIWVTTNYQIIFKAN